MLSSLERCSLAALMEDILTPPIDPIGALNTLLASPTLARWRQGATLDVSEWVAKKNGRTPIVIVSVAHLDDEERALVLGVLLEEILSRSGRVAEPSACDVVLAGADDPGGEIREGRENSAIGGAERAGGEGHEAGRAEAGLEETGSGEGMAAVAET